MLLNEHYLLPKRHLYSSKKWEINFWDVLYYLAAQHNGSFRVTARDVARLMSGGGTSAQQEIARQSFVQLRQQAVKNGELHDNTPEEGWSYEYVGDTSAAGYRRTHRMGERSFYHLAIPGYAEMKRGVILKPVGYIRHGWIRRVEPGLAKQVLNFLLSRPRRQFDIRNPERLDARPLADWAKEFAARRKKDGRSVRVARVQKALSSLVDLGLLQACARGYWLDTARLQHPGRTAPLRPLPPRALLSSKRLQSVRVRAEFPFQTEAYFPFAFSEDPDARVVVSATLRLRVYVANWVHLALRGQTPEVRQVAVTLVDARRQALAAPWQWEVKTVDESVGKRFDLSALVQELPALNGLGVHIRLDTPCAWLKVAAALELVVVA
ncbi:MAG: hypothetical protein GY803_11645 [Chloroflexi bacterium]|nr:hypothetical protein [Chloroflexota bacterium]